MKSIGMALESMWRRNGNEMAALLKSGHQASANGNQRCIGWLASNESIWRHGALAKIMA
jgi:hypothetical protein